LIGMVRAVQTIRSVGGVVLGVALACGVAACDSEGTTAACFSADGAPLPLYDIGEVDEDGGHPDPDIQDIRNQLSAEIKNDPKSFCLTAVGHATNLDDSGIPQVDSGSD
jgi:hypothetical protein